MGTHSKIILVAALTVSTSLLGLVSIGQATSAPPPIHPSTLSFQLEINRPENGIFRAVSVEEFDPEPNPPPKGTGGTGTR